ncbi:DNA polymerase III subunit delta [Brevibacillus sp. NPDC003359]|uniref:DNA polymerase III subunit delta n=1 Tax=unclassified Brevibacillus TaxID=2684853 RepID=UPI0036B2A124
MSMQQLKKISKEIQQKKFKPVYVLFGSETYLLKEFLKFAQEQMVEPEYADMNVNRYDATETPIEIALQDAETMPFLSDRKIVIVSRCNFLTAEKSKVEHATDDLLSYLENPPDFCSLFLIVDADKMDERKKIVKTLKKEAVVIPLSQMRDGELSNWIERRANKLGLQISSTEISHLVSVAGNNLYTLEKELEKISLYLGGHGVVTEDHISLLTTPALERDVFKLIEYVISGDVSKAYRTLYDCLVLGEEPIKLLALLVRQFRLLYLIKLGQQESKSLQEIADHTKSHPYAVRKAADQSVNFTEESLRQLYLQLAEDDIRMKNGKVDKRLAIELFISHAAAAVLSQSSHKTTSAVS